MLVNQEHPCRNAGSMETHMPASLKPLALLSPLPYLTAGFAPIVVMKELGFDREEGLDVEVRDVGIPGNAYRGLLNREGDATFINTIFTFLTRDKGSDMRIFGAYARHQNRSFVVPENSPVRTIEELKGATLGLFSMDHEEFAEATLQAHGIDPTRDVRFINYRTTKSYDADKMAAALKSGEIKAIWLLDITYGLLAVEGVKVRRLPSKAVDRLTPSSSLCTNDEVMAKRTQDLAGLSRAIARGTVFAHANPDAAIRLVWRYEPRTRPAPGEEPRALERDRVGLKVRLQNHGIEDPNRPHLGVIAASEIEAWRDFLFDTKAISQKLPVDDYFTTAAMSGVNDFDAPGLVKRAQEFKIS
jgi:NitT/TauT family transport system substrate-binding protein